MTWAVPGIDADDVSERLVDLASRAHDASHYLLTPRTVVTARSAADVARVLARAAADGRHVTLRSGGTSLSGQALSDDVLLDVREHFRDVQVLDGGARVRCQPGATIRTVNAHLARFGRRLGPDPASEIACTVGGVVANNSSGMSCGTERNTYRTLDSLVLVLPSGTVVDTGAPDADERLRAAEPALHQGLTALRDRVRGNPDSLARIAQQYAMKNTMGYGLNSFVDFDTAVKVLEHLVIGSEGTLGFVAEATFRTVPVLPHAATSLLVVPELAVATDALEALLGAGATSLELFDAASLRIVQTYREASPALAALGVDRHAALLVETNAPDAATLTARMRDLDDVMATLPVPAPPRFTSDARERADLWHLRKGLYTSVAGARPAGTTNLLEDVAVPLPTLTSAVDDLTALFGRHGYDDAVTFGHAKDGNLHFMINPVLSDPAQRETYAAFTEDLVDLVLARQGTLKAEHGTGRMMAPYVRRQFGGELHEVMLEVKRLCDPRSVLNPGTLLAEEGTGSHLAHLKVVPPVDGFVDRCVECGYCEPTCPSKDLTTTPRRRIALLREIAVRPADEAETLRRDYAYEAVDTCAVDSLCAKACPVGIDTGVFMKTFREARHPEPVQAGAARVAEGWGGTLTALRQGMRVASVLPSPLLSGVTGAARHVVSSDVLPLVGADLPAPGRARPRRRVRSGARAVLFASCLGELFGPSESGCGRGVSDAFLRVCAAAGVPVDVPALAGLCCGTPWVSKGLTAGARAMAEKTFDELWAATRHGELPVVGDAASCTHGLAELAHWLPEEKAAQWTTVRVEDVVTFVARECLPTLSVVSRAATVVVHPTCSMVHLGCVDDAVACARACADEVVVPVESGCCGFAGDRGMLHPELTASATAREAAEVARIAAERPVDAYVSANRTCELGMSRATGQEYRHVLEVLADHLG